MAQYCRRCDGAMFLEDDVQLAGIIRGVILVCINCGGDNQTPSDLPLIPETKHVPCTSKLARG